MRGSQVQHGAARSEELQSFIPCKEKGKGMFYNTKCTLSALLSVVLYIYIFIAPHKDGCGNEGIVNEGIGRA